MTFRLYLVVVLACLTCYTLVVGINHGWIQVGLTQKTSRVAYGFGDPPPPPAPARAAAGTAPQYYAPYATTAYTGNTPK
jgi:hypothetical protein